MRKQAIGARPLLGGQPVRYPDYERWVWNNGFRTAWLALGRERRKPGQDAYQIRRCWPFTGECWRVVFIAGGRDADDFLPYWLVRDRAHDRPQAASYLGYPDEIISRG